MLAEIFALDTPRIIKIIKLGPPSLSVPKFTFYTSDASLNFAGIKVAKQSQKIDYLKTMILELLSPFDKNAYGYGSAYM